MRTATISTVLCAALVNGLVAPARNADQAILLNPGPVEDVAVPKDFHIDLKEPRLVQFSEKEAPVWVTELDKMIAKAAGKSFFDVTEAQMLGKGVRPLAVKDFGSPNNTEAVKSVIKELSTKGPRENLEKFTSFKTRHYRSDTGKESELWLLGKIKEITSQYASAELQKIISVNEFAHSWPQSSILVKIAGSNPSADGAVIISAHQDSTNMWSFMAAPGADDDGSGTVTILEAYRALILSGFRPTEDVWFHWYSAEEGGLLGSQAVAKDWKSRNVAVKAQMQFDMTAWVKKGTREEVGIITDFVDPGLTEFNKKLVDAYLAIPYKETKCGYACSDHASWQKAGYRASFNIESTMENSNHYIHSTNDRIDISDEFSFDHMLEFSKLSVAFAIEHGGWKH